MMNATLNLSTCSSLNNWTVSIARRLKRQMSAKACVLVFGLACFAPASFAATEPETDDTAYDGTIMTVMWDVMKKRFLHEYPVVMDDRVKVIAPADAEDQFNVPVTVDAREFKNVQKIVVFADLSPIPEILTFEPSKAEPYVAFRFKMKQATPVRAAVLTDDNRWYVGTTLIDAAGGGCTAPAMAHGQSDWVSTLGQTRARVWLNDVGASRLRMTIRHPMDTGLAPGIPAFHIKTVVVKSEDGDALATLQIHEPIAENPGFTLLPQIGQDAVNIKLDTRDIEGNKFSVAIPVSS